MPEVIDIISFDKGLNLRKNSAILSDGELQECSGFIFNNDGFLKPVKPRVQIVHTAYSEIKNIHRYINYLLITEDNNIRYKWDLRDYCDLCVAPDEEFTSLGGGDIYRNRIIDYRNWVFMVNGHKNKCFNHANLYTWGVEPPKEACYGTAGNAGNPNGNYYLYYTYCVYFPNGEVYETGPSPYFSINVVSKRIVWSGIGICPYTGTDIKITRKLYRWSPTLGAIYFVDEIGDNTATTYTGLGLTSTYPTQDDAHVKATTHYDAGYWPYFATNPALPLIGAAAYNSWDAAAATTINQRFHIDLGSAKIIERIYYENFHNSGTATTQGVKDFTFWGSNEATAFAELTYATDTNWIQLSTSASAFLQHVASNIADPQYIKVTNTTAYRYYAFKFVNIWGGTLMGVRRIELQDVQTTTNEDGAADSEINTNNILSTQSYDVPQSQFTDIELYLQRIFGIKGTYLYFSEPYIPFGFKSTSSINVTNEGNDLVCVRQWGEQLYLASKSMWYRLAGTDPDTWGVKNSYSGNGVLNTHTVKTTKYGILGLWYNGIYLFDGSIAKNITEKAIGISLFTDDISDRGSCYAEFDGTRYYFYYPESGTTLSKCLMIDFTFYPELRFYNDPFIATAHEYHMPTGRRYSGKSGYTYEESSAGEAINVAVESGDQVGKNILKQKNLKYIYYDINTHDKNVILTVYIDDTAQTPTFTLNTSSRTRDRIEDIPTTWAGYRYDIRLTSTSLTDDNLEIYSPFALHYASFGD